MKRGKVIPFMPALGAAVCGLWLTALAQAGVINTTIALDSNSCGVTGTCLVTHSDSLPLANYSGSPAPAEFMASAEVDASSVHFFQFTQKESGDFVSVEWFDTYTLNGPPALFGTDAGITVDLELTGSMTAGTFAPPGCPVLAIGGAFTKIGAWDPVNNVFAGPFPGSTGGNFNFNVPCTSSPVTQAVDILASAQLTVTYGTPFVIAYETGSSQGAGTLTADFADTGVISFILPNGASITSDRGFGAAAGAPEPGSFVLAGLGVLALGLRRRAIYDGWFRRR
jgi:PEP-CTERM motif